MSNIELESEPLEDDAPSFVPPSPLPPPRFSIRSILLAMTLVGVLLTCWQAVGPLPTIVVVLLALSVAAHVAASAIGTSLRDRSSKHGWDDRAIAELVVHDRRPQIATTNLSQRQSLGWPIWISIGVGILVGGTLGIVLLLSTETEKATWQDTALGSLAFAALGGMTGFLLGSFVQVILRALYQANTTSETSGDATDNPSGSSGPNATPQDSPSM